MEYSGYSLMMKLQRISEKMIGYERKIVGDNEKRMEREI